MNVGYIYMDARQYSAAEKAFRRYLEYDNFDSDARLGYARALRAQERTIDAETQYYTILEFDSLYMRAFQETLDLYVTAALAPNKKFLAAVQKARDFDKKDEYDTELSDFARAFTKLQPSS